jgi:FdhD protein
VTRPGPSQRVRVIEHDRERVNGREDRLATEEPLEIRLGWPGQPASRLVVTMRTPGADFDLAVGFLFAEGIIGGPKDLRTVAYCTDAELSADERYNVVTVTLERPPPIQISQRYAAMSAACGVCGKQSLEDIASAGAMPVHPGPTYPADLILSVPDLLRHQQELFGRTGGLHASGLFGDYGEVASVREDVGRHNAVDKVIGHRLLTGTGDSARLLGVSGRIGFEIVQKAVAADLAAIVAVGAPSSLAVDLGHRFGITLVGFCRDRRFVVYAGEERIASAGGSANVPGHD